MTDERGIAEIAADMGTSVSERFAPGDFVYDKLTGLSHIVVKHTDGGEVYVINATDGPIEVVDEGELVYAMPEKSACPRWWVRVWRWIRRRQR